MLHGCVSRHSALRLNALACIVPAPGGAAAAGTEALLLLLLLLCFSSVTGLKVYAYELPTHLAFDMERFVGFQGELDTTVSWLVTEHTMMLASLVRFCGCNERKNLGVLISTTDDRRHRKAHGQSAYPMQCWNPRQNFWVQRMVVGFWVCLVVSCQLIADRERQMGWIQGSLSSTKRLMGEKRPCSVANKQLLLSVRCLYF